MGNLLDFICEVYICETDTENGRDDCDQKRKSGGKWRVQRLITWHRELIDRHDASAF